METKNKIKRVPIYGDMELDGDSITCKRIGTKLKVKLFNLIWVTFKTLYYGN